MCVPLLALSFVVSCAQVITALQRASPLRSGFTQPALERAADVAVPYLRQIDTADLFQQKRRQIYDSVEKHLVESTNIFSV